LFKLIPACRHANDKGDVERPIGIEGTRHGKVQDVDGSGQRQQVILEVKEFQLASGIGGEREYAHAEFAARV
jgi:hypothetical protein